MNINRTYLENKIFEMIYRVNKSTPHFNYKVNFEEGTITLELFTYNPLQKAQHFLHSVTSDTPVSCLTDMVIYLENHESIKKDKKSFTVEWSRGGSSVQKSYYYEETAEDALNKFFIGKEATNYETKVYQNPMA